MSFVDDCSHSAGARNDPQGPELTRRGCSDVSTEPGKKTQSFMCSSVPDGIEISSLTQEVTCYIDYNISMAAENLWRVEIVNGNPGEEGGDIWHSINSQVRLVHVSTEQALKFSGKVYADWGFYQNEVVCDKQVLI